MEGVKPTRIPRAALSQQGANGPDNGHELATAVVVDRSRECPLSGAV